MIPNPYRIFKSFVTGLTVLSIHAVISYPVTLARLRLITLPVASLGHLAALLRLRSGPIHQHG